MSPAARCVKNDNNNKLRLSCLVLLKEIKKRISLIVIFLRLKFV